MQITGRNHLSVDPATAWVAFHDAGVLERTLPGCQSMREVEPGRFAMTIVAGVAAIKGTYDGHATFSEETEPESFLLSLAGSGGPGTVNADVRVRLSPADDGGTDLEWTADAVVGGAVGGVGQRMLSSVARRLANQFFTNIDRDLASGGAPASGASTAEAGDGAGMASVSAGAPVAVAAPAGGNAPPPSPPFGVPTAGTVAGNPIVPMVVGAAIALVGVALGARLRRR